MSAVPLTIAGVGMACPLGLTAASACAAIRAGIDRRQELRFVDDAGRPIVGSALSVLPDELSGTERWIHLLTYALSDLFRGRSVARMTTLPLLVAMPEDPDARALPAARLAAELSRHLGVEVDARRIEYIKHGSSAGYHAFARARALLAQAADTACVVAAADSLIDARRLLTLSRNGRLLTQDNSDGVTPGEAAACVLVEPASRQALARIRGIGFASEPATLANQIALRGEGLAAAARAALLEAGLSLWDVDACLSDAGGESFAFKELVLVTTRLMRRRKESFPIYFAADQLGDVGAAAGVCNLVRAILGGREGARLLRLAISFAGSHDGDRSAIVMEVP